MPGIATILTGVRVPRMNAIMERWVKTLLGELDRTLVWKEAWSSADTCSVTVPSVTLFSAESRPSNFERRSDSRI